MVVSPQPVGPEPRPDDARILWDVVEEHFDEAEFLLQQWSTLLDSPLYRADELADGPEERLRAHLDGLAVGGQAVVDRVVWPVVEGDTDEPDRISTAVLALAQLSTPRWVDAIIERVGSDEDAVRRGALAAGLVASDRPDISSKVAAALERTPDALGRAQWLDVLGSRGAIPGAAVGALVDDPDPAVRAAAVRVARFASRAVGLGAAEARLTDADPQVALAAVEVGLILGSHAAWSLATQWATASGVEPRVRRAAMVWVAMLGERAQADALLARLEDAATRGDALWALGFSGRPAAADGVLAWLDDEEFGPLAAEAFAAITGLDPRADLYWVDPVEPAADEDDEDDEDDVPAADAGADEDIRFEDDDLDADLVPPPEEDLPIPNAAEIRAWWQVNRTRFDPQRRYLAGQVAHGSGFAAALASVSVRRRHAIAFEIAVRTRGGHHIPTRSLTGLQRPRLQALLSIGQLDGERPFLRIG